MSSVAVNKPRREKLSNSLLLFIIAIGFFILLYGAGLAFLGDSGFLDDVGSFKWKNLFDIFNEYSALIIVTLGLTIVMITGGIDISVAGVVAFADMACVERLNAGASVFEAIVICLGIGLGFGLLHGYLVAYLKIQPFIVTMAGMFFGRGMAAVINASGANVEAAKAPVFTNLMNSKISVPFLTDHIIKRKKDIYIPVEIEWGVVIAIVLLIVVALMLKYSRFGRSLYAVGGNQQSALMLGCNVQRTKFVAYVISGVLAGIAAFVYLWHVGKGKDSLQTGMEMKAIASSIIGGTMLSGGVGNVIGSFFGVLILGTIEKIVTYSGLTNLGPYWQTIFNGFMLCFFIVLQSVIVLVRGKSFASKKKNKADPTATDKVV